MVCASLISYDKLTENIQKLKLNINMAEHM